MEFFLCSQGPNFGPSPNGNLVTFFPILKKNPNLKKNIKKLDWDFFQDHHTHTHHTSYMTILLSYYHCILFLLQFNGNIACVIAIFLSNQKCLNIAL